ncbi:hypothetical protein [Amycolatopsis jiangsuensis]|uniref:Uncharacterized protein n=1 Tax=Amycolatopsis jiangsuensis TaxID=1181879 RepID=A0A840IP69_9PSEU|nr:hypothetical protein [Amycolatopsis jiangsuensis]MBB4684156.1 hypothetical protein [Amycolatopsis jiangsuensis]
MFATSPALAPDRREQLAAALEHGPFRHALSLAIDVSGLGLDRLRDRLAAAGAAVSTTTLSYWRTGRTAPARARSREAVRLLEDLLELPAGALLRLLDTDPGGQPEPPVPFVAWERLWGRRNRVLPLLTSFEAEYRPAAVVVSLHEEVHVGADRLLHRLRAREVVRAAEDGTQVRLVTVRGFRPGCPPELTGTRYCTAGRRESLPEQGFTVTELLLPRSLDRGETALVEYEFTFTDDVPDTSYDRRFRTGVHEHLLELHFAPGAEPAECHGYRRGSPSGPETGVTALPLVPGLPVHIVSAGVSPGIVGLRWRWD